MFHKILVPIDFSSHSDQAVRTAADLGRHYESEVLLIYVFEPIVYALPEGYMMHTPEQLTQMMAEFDRALGHARKLAVASGHARVNTKQVEGQIAPSIVDEAKQGGFDLIVMGSHGRKGLNRLLMGSVTEKVLRSAHCAVMCVHAPA